MGAVISGDALVSARPTLNGVGPRLLPADFSHDQDSAIASLGTLADVAADLFVPGHGPAWRGSMRDAADQALDRVGRAHARSWRRHGAMERTA